MAKPSSAEIGRMRKDLAKVRRAIAANLAAIEVRAEKGKRLIEEREAIRFALKDVEDADGRAVGAGGGVVLEREGLPPDP